MAKTRMRVSVSKDGQHVYVEAQKDGRTYVEHEFDVLSAEWLRDTLSDAILRAKANAAGAHVTH